jgi:uncharacterized membrane protein YeaQ/YmgE (transglycosylase-associated protein family)
MSVGEIVVYLVVALLCGLLGQMVAGRSLGGYVVSTIVGLIGAVIGRLIGQGLGAPEPFTISVGGKSIPVLWAIIGATLVTLLVCAMRRPSGSTA